MDFHSITDKFFVLDLPENLISTEAKQDSDLILHEYESVIPEVIKNLGNFNLSSCFLSEKSDQHSTISNERRGQNLSWNKKESSWRKLSDFDKKSDELGNLGHKFNGAILKKAKEVEIKLVNGNVDNFKNFTSFSSNYALDKLVVMINERFSIADNQNLNNNYSNNFPKTQTEIGKIIGSILKCNRKENSNTKESNSSKHLKYLNKYKIQDLYKINQIYKIENSFPTWYILCNYTIATNNNKNIINTNEFSMGPFSSECIVSFFKQGDITEDTKLKIDKSILKEEKTNSKLYALLNNQQGIKIKNLLKALNPKEELGNKKKKSFNNLSYKTESDVGYIYQNSGSNSSKNNPSKKFSYSGSNKKESYDGGSSNLRQNNFNYSDEYYYNKIMHNGDRI